MEQQLEKPQKPKDDLTGPLAIGTLGAALVGDPIVHGGWPGIGMGVLAAAFVYFGGTPYIRAARRLTGISQWLPERAPTQLKTGASKRSMIDRLLNHFPDEQAQPKEVTQVDALGLEPMEDVQPKQIVPRRNDAGELAAPAKRRSGVFLFSEVLETFTPSLKKIYLGTLEDGTMVFCRAEDLCHVALAGATRGGKSSIMRMLMAQLCYAGANVLILNPHYSRYILDKKEDWTPFEPYLMYDPMECRRYEVIEHYLKQVATELLPKRLDKFAHSQPVGKPYFLVLDELPAIVDHLPDAPIYLKAILREGAKVGLFLITAAQDFLVSTIFPKGGGAVRDCYRTVEYVGGDATTANVLLDMPAKDVPENRLGKGTVMLRCDLVKPAMIARVPLVENEALYYLLGPSTYVASKQKYQEEEDLVGYMVNGEGYEDEERHTETLPTQTRRHVATSAYDARRRQLAARRMPVRVQGTIGAQGRQSEGRDEARVPRMETQDERDDRLVLDAYQNGKKSGGAITVATGVPANRVNYSLHRLAEANKIDWQPRK